MVSLSLLSSHSSLSLLWPTFYEGVRYGPQGRRFCVKGGGGDNSWVLDPRRGDRYKFQTKFYTLSTLFSYGSLMVYLSCPHTLLSLYFVPPLTKVWDMTPRGYGAMDSRERWLRILGFLSLGGGPLQCPNLTHNSTHIPSKREKKGGETENWRMEGIGKQTTYRFTNFLSFQGYHIQIRSYQHMHPCLEIIK